MSSSYGKKLREIRLAEGLTQPKFAELTGVSLGTIRNYETGQTEVGLQVLSKVLAHPLFEKYALWLMTDKSAPVAGQISPPLSPDGHGNSTKLLNILKVG
ncbi:helix-turn-helix transcriptional regulator [Enterobacter ludwigii]|uniref:helix-turn-helix transcriptional regulator n=1 Tax=Enterobacter ludwigii TaxID=299767 RepID=UPI003F6F8ED1